MQILENISLKPYNTFAIDVKTKSFGGFASVEELSELLTSFSEQPILIIGGGSNILLTKDFDGLVIKNEIGGIKKVNEDDDFVYIQAGAGVNWHQFVLHCIDNKWAGIENLSLIPGSVGASPMQNIGAYGVEVKDVFHELNAFHRKEKTVYSFGLKACDFGYRESIFKGKYKNEFVITDVTFKLWKRPVFNTSYGAIENELARMGVKDISIKAISDAVINIRSSKLPDPKIIGNAGSFFKNPTISKSQFDKLQSVFENIVAFENADETVKVAAGWLIEQCGWKGFRRGDAGCHAKQALVLVNYGNAKGKEIYKLSEEIIRSVYQKFTINLEREVNII